MAEHRGPEDRGSADFYYGRERQPHKYVKRETGRGEERITLTDPKEIALYNKGYDEAWATKW
jgi:hypothetical protein